MQTVVQTNQAGERTQRAEMPSQSEMDYAAGAMLPEDFNAWLDECAEQVAAANSIRDRMQHTPGPWTVETFRQHGENFDSTLIRAHGENADALNEDNMTVARLTGCRNAEANADLIAAAPELLDLCKTLIIKSYVRTGDHQDYQTHPAIIEAIRSAISKAEGTTNV